MAPVVGFRFQINNFGDLHKEEHGILLENIRELAIKYEIYEIGVSDKRFRILKTAEKFVPVLKIVSE